MGAAAAPAGGARACGAACTASSTCACERRLQRSQRSTAHGQAHETRREGARAYHTRRCATGRRGAPRALGEARGNTAPAQTARRGTEKWIPAQSLPIRPIRRRPGHPVPSTGSHPPAVGASARAYLLRRPVGARPRQLRRAGRPHPPTRATAPGRTAVRPLAVALVAQVDPLTPPAPPQGGTRRAQAVPRPRRAEGRMHFLSDKPG